MDGKFALHSLPLPADAPLQQKDIFQEHMAHVVRACRAAFPSLEAVILYGGYGRGEGSWVQRDGRWEPYNDYDITVVVRKKIAETEIDHLRKKLAIELDIRWVDLSQKYATQLSKLKPSIYNYDLKYASATIYGDRSLVDRIPNFDPSEIPTREILTLFVTRLWTFLGSLRRDGFKRSYEGGDAMFFRNQMAKAVLAVVDAMLVPKGLYHHSYKERVARACALEDVSDKTKSLLKWALLEKLTPKSPSMQGCDVERLYNDVHSLYSEVMINALNKHFRKDSISLDRLPHIYTRSRDTILMRIAYPILKRTLRFERVLQVNLAQIYIYASYRPAEPICLRHLSKGVALLRRIDPGLPKNMTWDEARFNAANLRNNV